MTGLERNINLAIKFSKAERLSKKHSTKKKYNFLFWIYMNKSLSELTAKVGSDKIQTQ